MKIIQANYYFNLNLELKKKKNKKFNSPKNKRNLCF